MNAIEFKRCREALGLTQRELARVLRLGPNGDRDLRRYEAGKRPVPGPVSVVMDMLVKGHDPMKTDEPTFTCAMCGGVFEFEWSHDEAVAEAEQNFGKGCMETMAMDVICDDCYQRLPIANGA